MKAIRQRLVLLFACVVLTEATFVCCTDKGKERVHPLEAKEVRESAERGTRSDSIYSEQTVLSLYASNPQRALVLIDSAEMLGNMSDFRANLLRAQVYAYPGEATNLDTAKVIAETLLEHNAVKADAKNRMSVLRLLIDIARIHVDYNDQERWATQLSTLCREQGDETEALRTESEIGIVLTHLGQRKEGFEMLDRAIRTLDEQRHFNELDACIIAMKRKLTVLSLLPQLSLPDDSINAEQRNADVIQLAHRLIAKLDDYERHPDDYADGSSRQPDAGDVPDYCTFYRAQAYVFLAHAYASQSVYGNEENEKSVAAERAHEYLSLFEQTPFGSTLNGRVAITGTLCMLGEYDKMLATYDEIDSLTGADTLHTEYVSELRNRAIAAAARSNHAASQNYWHRYSLLSEAVNNHLQASEAHNYAARYQAQKLEMALQEEQAARSKIALLCFIIGLALCFSTAFLLYFFHQRRILKKKNRALVSQISEAIKYKGLNRSLSPNSQISGENGSPLIDDKAEIAAVDEKSPASLFHLLSQTIINEQLFLDPTFDRQAAMERFHLSKERIGTAFAQGSEYTSLSAFVTACRVEYAARLLIDCPEMPVVQVAAASGFSNVSHFGRSFKSSYGLSPTEFRKQR